MPFANVSDFPSHINAHLHILALHPRAYVAWSHLAPTALDLLRVAAEFPDEARHSFAAAYGRLTQREPAGSSASKAGNDTFWETLLPRSPKSDK